MIELFLVDESNEFQRLLRDEAGTAARKAGLELATRFTGDDFSVQLTQLRACVTKRPQAILVLSVRDRGLGRVAAEAARAGIHWMFLNRAEDELDDARAQSPGVAVTMVCPDERETGRIQGRLMRALHPGAGKVLYVQGSRRSLAARDRTLGVQEALQGSGLDVALLEAGWSEEESRNAVRDWLRIAGRMRLGLVGGQNDLIASGAMEALATAARETDRPELATVPVIGCDGTPGFGQRLVKEGRLKATVVLPRWSGLAVETIARTLKTGQLPPPVVTVTGTAFPREEDLPRPPAGRPGGRSS
jgi:ABC-type sugar transport system substrate-binding protein